MSESHGSSGNAVSTAETPDADMEPRTQTIAIIVALSHSSNAQSLGNPRHCHWSLAMTTLRVRSLYESIHLVH